MDADACPVIDDIVELAPESEIHLVHNQHHFINSTADNVTIHLTGDGPDQADHLIYNLSQPGDLVVTDDLGLAALALGGGRDVLRFRGDKPTNQNIDAVLEIRHAAARHRKAGNYQRGPARFSEEDRIKFRKGLKKLLQSGVDG